MKLILPKPPTTNQYYRITGRGGFGKMYISKEGKDWQEESLWKIKQQRTEKTPITTECEVWITTYTSTWRDADASTKQTVDILQTAKVIENDKLFYAIHALREKCKKGEDKVVVEILGY